MHLGSVAAVRSLLSAEQIGDLAVAAFGLERLDWCRFFNFGINDHYRIRAGGSDYALRVYTEGWRTDDAVQWELELLDHVRRGLVAAPLPTVDGRHFATIDAVEGRRQVALFEWVPGPHTWHEHAVEYGETLARLHDASAGFVSGAARAALDLDLLVSRPVAVLERSLDGDAIALVRRAAERVVDSFEATVDGLPTGPCHGDTHGANANLGPDGIRFYDFDLAAPGPLAYDLAVYRWSVDLHRSDPDAWTSFLDGYRRRRPVTDAELDAVPTLVLARMVWLLGFWAGTDQTHPGFATIHDQLLEPSLALLRRALDD